MSNGQPTQNQKKGLSNLAWIGIGCAVVLFTMLVAVGVGTWWLAHKAKEVAADFESNPGLAAARLIVKASPELEEVGVDEDAGTMTVRNTSSGEEITVNFRDIKDGKISFSSDGQEVQFEATGDEDGGRVSITGDKGTMSFAAGERVEGARPEWAPLYSDCEPEGEYAQTREDGISGAVRCMTADDLETVVEYYRNALEADSFSVRVNTLTGDDGQVAMLSADDERSGRTVIVNATREAEATVIALTYNQRVPSTD